MLYQYNPKTALYFGHRYLVPQLEEGYMAGGGYILSKKAVKKFVEKIIPNETLCDVVGDAEDFELGRCLAHSAISVDCRDEFHEKRFFPAGVIEHMKGPADPTYWFTRNQYYNVSYGSTKCCSNTSVAYHYIGVAEMYKLEKLIYESNPYGLDQSDEQLPRKFTLQEIISASDANSTSPYFRKHSDFHDLESSELF
jgi:glycoprotein-N-acetylgalactosamine 3-beta-galactosyltransferase